MSSQLPPMAPLFRPGEYHHSGRQKRERPRQRDFQYCSPPSLHGCACGCRKPVASKSWSVSYFRRRPTDPRSPWPIEAHQQRGRRHCCGVSASSVADCQPTRPVETPRRQQASSPLLRRNHRQIQCQPRRRGIRGRFLPAAVPAFHRRPLPASENWASGWNPTAHHPVAAALAKHSCAATISWVGGVDGHRPQGRPRPQPTHRRHRPRPPGHWPGRLAI